MDLKKYRNKIDQIDKRLVALLNDRAKASLAIGKEKMKNKKGIYAPAREQAILKKIARLNKGPMSQEAFEAIYREIMSSSLALEKALQIAYFGAAGSFTHLAAVNKFGSQVNYMPSDSILEVFQKVEHGECDYGVVPIENSTEGAVTHTFDLLVDSELKICAQILLPVSQHLMSKSALSQVKKVYSHPQVFGQCRHWLFKHVPKAAQVEVSSPTQAAQVALKEKGAAAIGSRQAAKIYGLKVIASSIQDNAHNVTRFLVISSQDVPPTGRDRTSILFSIKDRVGALHAMLSPFEKNKINLTKIESRPSKKKAWDYFFFVDFEGHREDVKVKKALAELEEMCKYLKVLGSYPNIDR